MVLREQLGPLSLLLTAWQKFTSGQMESSTLLQREGERESTRGTGCFSPTEGNASQDLAPGHHVPCAATGSSCVKVGKNSNPMKLKLKHLMLALNTAFEQLKIKICFKFLLDFQFLIYQLI